MTRTAAPATSSGRADSERDTAQARLLPLEAQSPEELRAVLRTCRAADATDVAELRTAALHSPDPAVVGNALQALGRLHAIARDVELGALVDDPRPRVRAELVRAAGVDGHPSTVPMLVRALDALDPDLVRLSIEALGRVRDERARDHLRALLDDERTGEVERAFARSALAASVSEHKQASGVRRPDRKPHTFDR